MRRRLLDILCCPACAGALALDGAALAAAGAEDAEIEEGVLACAGCAATWPVERGIPRFVPRDNYASNFDLQWNSFRSTQLDSVSGLPISSDRFALYTGWDEEALKGALVLDAGCGAGRFAEIALSRGARVVAVDYSGAIDAARANLGGDSAIDFVQADINALPFAPGTFPFVYCLGVIQHTPDPERSFRDLAAVTAPAGRLAIDVYAAGWKNLFFAKYWIRPLTRRMSAATSLRIVRRIFPPLYALSRAVGAIPVAGRKLRFMIPVANYSGVYPLDKAQLREWALLDTFDMWAPAYDQPQTLATLGRWFRSAGFTAIETFRAGFFVGRGMKPAA